MPTSEDCIKTPNQPTVFESTNEAIIREMFELIKSLRAENAALVEQLITAYAANAAYFKNPTEQEQRVEIPEHMEYIGKMPWYLRQQLLQKACKKPKLSEIAGIPEEGDEPDAG